METDTRNYRTDHSLSGLIRELRDETTTLLRQEVALAKTEMSEKASTFGRNAIYLALGGAVAYAGFIFILLMMAALIYNGLLSAGLTLGTAQWLAPGIVGVVIGVVGYALIQKALNTFSREGLAPEKTIQSLKEDKRWTEEKFSRA
jgi:xanthine/uracil permease